MKIVLAALMCLVLCTSECFALKGGPVYPGSTNLVGNYSGVLQGVFDPTNPASSNSIGIFSLGVPATGNATGAFVMFSRGRVFTGTVQAAANPEKASLKGILSATFDYTVNTIVNGELTTIDIEASANGPISATVANSKSSSLFGNTNAILRGSATLNVSQGQLTANLDPVSTVLSLVVSGVKQSG